MKTTSASLVGSRLLRQWLGVVVGTACLAVACPVNAALAIQYTQSFSGVPNLSPTLSLNQFDPALGTLQSVEVWLTLSASGGDFTVDNDGTDSGTVTIEFGTQGSLSSSDVSLIDTSFQPIASGVNAVKAITTGSAFLSADDGDGSGVQTDGTDWYRLVGSDPSASDSGTVPMAAWTSGNKGYIGTGLFNVSVDVITWTSAQGLSGLAGAFNPVSASGEVGVRYTYVPVPEPGQTAMLVGGLLVAGSMLRRRFSKRPRA